MSKHKKPTTVHDELKSDDSTPLYHHLDCSDSVTTSASVRLATVPCIAQDDLIPESPVESVMGDLNSPTSRKTQLKDRPLDSSSHVVYSTPSPSSNTGTLESLSIDVLEHISLYLNSQEVICNVDVTDISQDHKAVTSDKSDDDDDDDEHEKDGIGPNEPVTAKTGALLPVSGPRDSLLFLGSKTINQKLGQFRVARLTPRVASYFYFPTVALSYYSSLQDLTISMPEFYEHMPFEDFPCSPTCESPSAWKSLPCTVRHLELNFRNAALLFKHATELRNVFPYLESLVLDGIDGPSLHFLNGARTTMTNDEDIIVINRASIEGLSTFRVKRLEVSVSEISNLPRSLTKLEGVYVPDMSPGAHEWPVEMAELVVMYRELNEVALESLRRLQCLVALDIQIDENFVIDLETFESLFGGLQESLRHIVARFGKVEILSGGSPPPVMASPSLFRQLPRSLLTLVCSVPHIQFDLSGLSLCPPTLTTLKIFHSRTSHAEDIALDPSCLPSTLVHLILPLNAYPYEDPEYYATNLQKLPSNLKSLSLTSLFIDHLNLLPKTLTDLSVRYFDVSGGSDGDVEHDEVTRLFKARIDSAIDAKSLPLLKSFRCTVVGMPEDHEYQIVPWGRIFPNLKTFDAGFEPSPDEDSVFTPAFPKHCKHLGDGTILDEVPFIDMMKSLTPNVIKSYKFSFSPDNDPKSRSTWHELQHLPPSLTAFSADSPYESVDLYDELPLPPHLVYLSLPLDNDEELPKNLPRTLRYLRRDDDDGNNNDVPPFCRVRRTWEEEDALLEGRWWRGGAYNYRVKFY